MADKYGPWLDWHGGECPVDLRTTVKVTNRSAETVVATASAFPWNNTNDAKSVMHYRVKMEPDRGGEYGPWIGWNGGGEVMKRSDQIAMLKACANFTKTGEWEGMFSYPNCGWDLVQSGLVNEDKTITIAGRSALYLFCEGEDPTPESKSFQTFNLRPKPEVNHD